MGSNTLSCNNYYASESLDHILLVGFLGHVSMKPVSYLSVFSDVVENHSYIMANDGL